MRLLAGWGSERWIKEPLRYRKGVVLRGAWRVTESMWMRLITLSITDPHGFRRHVSHLPFRDWYGECAAARGRRRGASVKMNSLRQQPTWTTASSESVGGEHSVVQLGRIR